jgi:hypothetical protein
MVRCLSSENVRRKSKSFYNGEDFGDTMSSLRGTVENLHRALSLAIYDRELELKGKKISYYYDADVIYPLIMGFEVDSPDIQPKKNQLLIRALLSCQYFGEFHMLRPHALELTEKLRKLRWSEDESSRAVFQQRVTNFLERKGIRKILAALCDIVEGKKDFIGTSEKQRVKFFLDTLRDNAGDTFSYIEQVNGTWRQRLKRYYDKKMLNLDYMGPEIYDLLKEFEIEAREINRILLQKRSSKPESVFQDALSLTVLHKMIKDRENGKSDNIVRFYTETIPIIEELEENREIQNLLSYKEPLDKDLDTPYGAEFVFRDAGYFIMRAWFSELSYEKKLTDSEAIRDVKELAEILEDLVTSDSVNFDEGILKLKIKKQIIFNLIENFEQLTIMDSIWVSDRIPKDWKNLKTLQKWTEVFKFAEREETENILDVKIQDVRHKIESKLSLLQAWKNDTEIILIETKETRKRVKGRIDEIMRDLGLVRWGYSLFQEEKLQLIKTLRSLLQEDNYDALIIEAGNTAIIMKDAKKNSRACMVMCGILWALRLYSYIVNLVRECESNCSHKKMPPSLLIIQMAAEIKIGKCNAEERAEIGNRVLNFLKKNVEKEERLGVLLGIGYVLYHVWKQENIGSEIGNSHQASSDGNKKEKKDWAQLSFTLGEEAVDKFPKGELAWAFAVNHCAYVGIQTGIEPEKTRKYFSTLLEIESLQSCWNFRFDDTVGIHYLKSAQKQWKKITKYKDSNVNSNKILEMLRNAEEYFIRAKEKDIGDIDIKEHMNQCNLLKEEIEDFQK